MAEREGFEPSIRFCRILTFQASAFDHSATAPHALEGASSSGRRRSDQRLDPFGEGDVLRRDAAFAVGRKQDIDPVPDVRPIGVMVELLGHERDPRHDR